MSKTLQSVKPLVDATLANLAKRKFKVDPLLGQDVSRRTSVAASAQRRHGTIIEKSIVHRLGEESGLQVWNEPAFHVSKNADQITSGIKTISAFTGAQLPYLAGDRTIQVDCVVYDPKKKSIAAYEIKRGTGKHDAGKTRSLLRDILCVQILLMDYAIKRGLKVKSAHSYAIFYYGECSVGKPFSLTKAELDSHFGISLVNDIEAVNAYFAKELAPLIV